MRPQRRLASHRASHRATHPATHEHAPHQVASTTNPNLNPNPNPNPTPNQVGFDDNAAFRHAPIFDKRDLSQVRACVSKQSKQSE